MEGYSVSGFLLFTGAHETLKVALGCSCGFLKCVFLAPMDNGGRAYLLYDPVKDLGIVTGIQQDICDEVTTYQPGIFRFRGLFCCCKQLEFPHDHEGLRSLGMRAYAILRYINDSLWL